MQIERMERAERCLDDCQQCLPVLLPSALGPNDIKTGEGECSFGRGLAERPDDDVFPLPAHLNEREELDDAPQARRPRRARKDQELLHAAHEDRQAREAHFDVVAVDADGVDPY